MFDQYISTLLSSIFSLYLPIEETGTRIAVSLALSNIFIFIGKYLVDHLNTFHFITKYFERGSSIKITSTFTCFNYIDNYIYKYHLNKIKNGCIGYNFDKDKGFDLLNIDTYGNYIIDSFNYEGKTYNMYIKSYRNSKKEKDKDTAEESYHIISYDYNDIKIIQKYINYIYEKEEHKIDNNKYTLYYVVCDNKNRDIKWNYKFILCNKNMNNTIISENSKKHFINDIDKFINSKEKYIKLGRPYKRGYILYGEPGCGKTSLIKIISTVKKLPIFSIDLSIFKNNEELLTIVNKITDYCGGIHILLFEDVDRCKIFDKNKPDDYEGVTEDCLLNILDGVDEVENRITIMTTNNLDILKGCPALVRHGRIDKCVNVTYCDLDQIIGLLKLYFPDEKVNVKELETEIKITPATLVHLIEYVNDLPKIINFLNKQKDLSSIDIESFDFSS